MDALLKLDQSTIDQVRKYYKTNQKSIDQNVDILKVWMKQQPHLPEIPDDNLLERILLRNKFRIEVAKEKLENYYTLRGVYREFYQKFNHDFIPSKEAVSILVFPKMTRKNERLCAIRLNDLNPDNYNLIRICKFAVLLGEIILRHDYAIGERIILDCHGKSLEHIKRISPVELERAIYLYRNCYSALLISIDIINAPTFLNVLLNIFKLALPTQIYKKINVHNSYESLHKLYPKECLPKEYGGDFGTCPEIIGKWDRIFLDYQEFFTTNYDNVSNEKLRVGDVAKNEIFGVDGTFKTINLD